MSIDFHCDHCGKLIRAPSDAGGRRGKCPYCHQSVYIKTPSEEIEDIPLTPLDAEADAAEARAKAEADRLAQSLLRERDADAPGAGSAPVPAASAAEIEGLVVDYLRALIASELEQAERLGDQIRPHRAAALKIIERIGQDSIPPPGLDKIPPAVLSGFLNSLRAELQG